MCIHMFVSSTTHFIPSWFINQHVNSCHNSCAITFSTPYMSVPLHKAAAAFEPTWLMCTHIATVDQTAASKLATISRLVNHQRRHIDKSLRHMRIRDCTCRHLSCESAPKAAASHPLEDPVICWGIDPGDGRHCRSIPLP